MTSWLPRARSWPRLSAAAMGVLGAAAGSVVVAVSSALLAGFAIHPFESAPWLFGTSVVPSSLAAVALRVAADRARAWSPWMWLNALFASFLVGALAGSFGAAVVQSLRFGLSHVNVVGYLQWSPLYGIGLLPITYPIGLVLARVMWSERTSAGR